MMGSYRGVRWVHCSLSDEVDESGFKQRWYWPINADGRITGIQFRTYDELRNWVHAGGFKCQPDPIPDAGPTPADMRGEVEHGP
jgi:hypothetical protein